MFEKMGKIFLKKNLKLTQNMWGSDMFAFEVHLKELGITTLFLSEMMDKTGVIYNIHLTPSRPGEFNHWLVELTLNKK